MLKAKNTAKPQLDQTYDKLPLASQSYGMTPAPEDRQPMPSSNPDNYGIDDAGTDDSSEDECKPKKVVPLWAQCKYSNAMQSQFPLLISNKWCALKC